ncbi:MAG: AgmX/PglI C-terminal domain-containing protein [Sandaracinaceae bacterium]
MTMAMQAAPMHTSGPKVLRVGLIQSGKIIEERILRKRETITIGTSEKNHFVVTDADLGARFELFQLVGDGYVLNFTPTMSGRVGLAGAVQTLDELRANGGARKAEGYAQVKLADSSRGKVVVGDTTLLFQLVAAPPIQPRPQLPAAVTSGFAAGVDWLFTSFVMFSFMLHFGFIIYLENADWAVEPGIASVPDHVADIIFQEPEPPEPEAELEQPNEPEPDEGEPDSEPVAENRPTPRPRDQPSTPRDRASADDDARLAIEVANEMVQHALLGAITNQNGAFANVLEDGMVTTSNADLMATADGVGVATDMNGGTLHDRSGGDQVAAITGNIGSMRRQDTGGAQREGDIITEVVVRHGTANVGALEEEDGVGVFDPNIVVRQIRQRLRAIQTCYERELTRNPTLAGRVMVRFSIQPIGTVSGTTATENTTGSPEVAACVVRTISRFRFTPGPEGGAVTFAYPFVFAPQN